MLLPVALSQFTLLLPGTLVPDELQVVGKLLPQPQVRAVGTVHPIVVGHVLVGDGIDSKLAYKTAKLVGCACLLHPPDSLCQCVGTAPCRHIDRPGVVLVGQTNKKCAARRVVILTDGLDAAIHAAHHGTLRQIVGTGPVTHLLLSVLLFQG